MINSTSADKPGYKTPTAVRVKMANYLTESIDFLQCWGVLDIDPSKILEIFRAGMDFKTMDNILRVVRDAKPNSLKTIVGEESEKVLEK